MLKNETLAEQIQAGEVARLAEKRVVIQVPKFNHRYFFVPKPVIENPGGDYLVEDAGLLTDNKTRIEQMLLAGTRLNELSKFYTYDDAGPNKPIEDFEDLALDYGIDKLQMSEKLKQFEAGLKARLDEARASGAASSATGESDDVRPVVSDPEPTTSEKNEIAP